MYALSHFLFTPECNAAIHKKCIDKIIYRCTGTAANSRDTMVGEVDVFQCACKMSTSDQVSPARHVLFYKYQLEDMAGVFTALKYQT